MRQIAVFVINIAVIALCAAGCGAQAADAPQPVIWDFESEDTGWRPRANTITLERTSEQKATEQSTASLRVSGPIATGWNYAMSGEVPMTAGKLYRLSAWVKLVEKSQTTEPPFLKCEFVAEDRAQQLGRANTEPYDVSKLGAWQQLAGEFSAPEGVVACWIALEKGADRPMQIDLYIDDVKLEQIDHFSIIDRYTLDPLPDSLKQAQGVHPRVYLNAERIAQLREAIQTTHADLWAETRQIADNAVAKGPPAYIDDDGHSGAEQLWQREVGNRMPYLALAYVLTQDAKYSQSAQDWALASCRYPTWGLGGTDGLDLAAGHQLFGLGIVYDWCYDALSEQACASIRETLMRRGGAMFDAASGRAWWKRSYLQNHLWVNVCGMSVAGAAIYDEHPQALAWLGIGLDRFSTTMEALGEDGASHEGVGYWDYGVEYMLKFMELARGLLDVDMYDHDWWRNTAYYRHYLALPRNAWTRSNCIVDIADCPRGNWYGPEYLLRRLASEYRDGHAQWLAGEIDAANVDSPSARWLNLLWYDPSIEPTPPAGLPTLRHFDDMDIVSARSDWSGDESLVVFKCGPYIGHKAVEQFSYDPGGGHVHPDANHFVVFGNGEWIIRDDGYRAKWTGHHNTLLIDGVGQMGEGQMWFQGGQILGLKARPRVTRAVSTDRLDHITGDATEAYSPEAGLKRYIRHLLYIKPNVLIVIDDIETAREAELQLRLHPEYSDTTQHENGAIVHGKLADLRVDWLTPQDVTTAAGDVEGGGRAGAPFSMFTLSAATHASKWRNASALTWCAKGEQAPVVTMQEQGNAWVFAVGDDTVTFDWASGQAEVQ